MRNQHQTPLLDGLKACSNHSHAPFYTPGHKRGQGVSQPLADLLGTKVFRADLTELADLDNLFTPQGVILAAQQLAAEAFGASQTWFLVNGSTCGIEAAILATCGTGDKIILPRNVHSSAIAGLILSGAIPIFVNPEYDPVLDIAHSITPRGVAAALQKHPDVKAVLVVYPTYYGVCGDLQAIAQITDKYNIPLLVDEAHGAHFAFHPQLPTTALAAGADLTVQSIHKVLGAMTQASMLHVQGQRIDIHRLNKALQLVQSTSPSFVLLASLDAARQQMALHGKALMSRTLELADAARKRISEIPGLSVLQMPNLDPTRLTVTVSRLGLTGFTAEEILDQQLDVTAEFASLQHLTFIISLGNTSSDIERLVQGLMKLQGRETKSYPPTQKNLILWDDNLGTVSPREAFFAVSETLPLAHTSHRICTEIVCPYPPGIPVLMPGEVITPAALEYLQQVQSMGGFISGCADASLKTLKVVKIIGNS
ncbi:aminotransferase class I/II-fold pyridoxal phosphate-dependent enzyme [Umezakia ovalisporum]|uniref:Aminotransferase class I/II-fold pyridoxal phosphate-dependent enzyme n=1 Tax=Umezakia ovalisporum FSS-43 TaxID=2740520 RepID=A0ABT6K5S4_9CYAN|nr:aminotransferase class I/II-fold pyridoxal phosphate-dependent enzyme [Umezakia ovalisporum]MBI1243107.1 aminotransferase class I/II-fold pyridoxal phosphate-dependent enzyme [Nostoc sp. RI_552]MDH6057695.1 aminotransferase class I/II-fold pyridoxal phosphate-dependent enzyme [Umezakia ovalisporum FSS-43]MDH6067834.1 aminotransferase class I/II-fold pyridoxal phosphate-dependent enzyme [Umezakia ovalisporum APH033B]MDH6072272.1 aminotransferase class I/II-fold pyridoxal phosphate-dependent e